MRVRHSLFKTTDVLRPVGDIRDLCRVGRFCLRERRLGGARGGLEAVLAPAARDRFEIYIDPEPPGGWARIPPHLKVSLQRQRLRFRVAHEIAHSFFYERNGAVPRRRLAGSEQQEEFCDRFAAEFLLPRDAVSEAGGSAEGLVRLAERFDVSLQLAARSFAGRERGVLVALFLCREEGLRRQWVAGDDQLPTGWWRNVDLNGLARSEELATKASLRSGLLADCEVLPLPERGQLLLVA